MKWKTKIRKRINIGDTRIGWHFFVLPQSVDGTTYWLTLKKVVLEANSCTKTDLYNWDGSTYEVIRWIPIKLHNN